MPMSGGGRAVPNGWQARWLDDQLLDMNPQESRIRTLRITVPGGIQPIYQGFSLSAASTQGNLTWTTTLVVNVTEETNGTYTDLTDSSVQWLPGTSENLSVKFTNLGTYYAEHIHSVQSKTGECEFQVMQPDGGVLAPSEPETLSVQAIIPSSAHLNDTCSVTLQAANIADNSSIHTNTINLTIGVSYALRLDSPSSILNISPGETKQVTWVVANDGSEEDEVYFESQSAPGVSIYPPSTWVVVERGDSEQFNVDVSVAEGISIVDLSTFTITAKSRHSQASSAAVGVLNISARYGYSVAGPADNRVQVLPNSSTQFSITVDSDSTVNQSLSLGSSGLSSELSLVLENESQSMVLEPSSQFTISLLLNASPTAALGDHAFSIIMTSDDGGSEALNLMAQVLAESDVKISATSEWVVVGSREVVSTAIHITNLGNSNDTFLIEVDDSSAGTSLEVSMNTNSVSLEPGQSSNVDITLRRLSDGPAQSVNLIISASSTTDDSTFSWNLTVLEQTVGASVVFLNTPSEVSPSETLSGSLVLSNTGNAADSFLLSMSGLTCSIAPEHELEAGASSAAIPFTCNASESLLAGAKNLELSIHSLSDPSATISASHILEVSSSFIPGVDVVEITVSSSEPAMNYDSSTTITITVKNKVNHIIDISLSLEGDDSGLVYASWTDLSSDIPSKTARLGPGSSASFSLQLDSMTNDQSIAHLTILVSSSFDGLEVIDRSGAVDVSIAGPHQAPSGLALPFSMEIDNQKGLTYLAGGWILSFVLLSFIILRAKSRKGREDEMVVELPPLVDLPPPMLDEPEIALQVPTAPIGAGGLGVGEVRITPDRRVECPSCQAKLGLPRGSEPPFRFTCPTCESSIRVIE